MKSPKNLNSFFSDKGISRHVSFSKQEKLKGVKLVLNGGCTPRQAARKIGCPVESLERWVKSYQNHRRNVQPAPTNLSISDWLNRKETFSEKTRINAVKQFLLKGVSRKYIAQKVGCSVTELSEWIAELRGRVKADPSVLLLPPFGKPRSRLSEKRKKEIVRKVLFEEVSVSKASQDFGVAFSSVKNWVDLYAEQVKAENLKQENPRPVRVYSKFSEEKKKDAVKRVLFERTSIQRTAQEFGVSFGSVKNWVDRYAEQVKAENPGTPVTDPRRPRAAYPVQERMQAVEMVLYGGASYEEISNKFCCSIATLYNWVRAYRKQVMAANPGRALNKYKKVQDSAPGETPSSQNKNAFSSRMTQQQRKELVRMVLAEGCTYRKAAQTIGCTEQSAILWVKRFIKYLEEHNPEKAAVAKARIGGRRKEAFREVEEECRKKAGPILNGTIEEKRRFVEQHRREYSVLMLCRILGLDPHFYYQTPKHKKIPSPKERREELARQIAGVDREFQHQLTYDKIFEVLNRRGITCKLMTVMGICKKLGIAAARKKRDQDRPVKQNRLKKQDNPVKQNRLKKQDSPVKQKTLAKPEKVSVTVKTRMQTAKRVLFEGCTPARAAAEVGRTPQSILLWVRKYEKLLREKYPDLPVNDGRKKEALRKKRIALKVAAAAAKPKRPNKEAVTSIDALFQDSGFDRATQLKAVHAVIVKGLTPEDAAKRIGAEPGEVRVWVSQLSGDVLPKSKRIAAQHRKRHRHTAVSKILFEQYPLEKAAAKLGCSTAQMHRWVQEEYRHLRETFPQKFERITWQPVSQKPKRIPSEEDAFLRESQDLLEADIKTKFEFINKKSKTYAVPMMCRLLGVDESTYEQWNNAPAKNLVVGRDSLVEKVKEVNAGMGGKASAQQIWKMLGEQGIRCGIGQIHEICKELGIRHSLLPPK